VNDYATRCGEITRLIADERDYRRGTGRIREKLFDKSRDVSCRRTTVASHGEYRTGMEKGELGASPRHESEIGDLS